MSDPKPKFDKEGARLCDNVDCDLVATHTLVFNQTMCYCIIHANQALTIADAMGYPTPALTVREMTLEEMMPEDSIAFKRDYIMQEFDEITDVILEDGISLETLEKIADLVMQIKGVLAEVRNG